VPHNLWQQLVLLQISFAEANCLAVLLLDFTILCLLIVEISIEISTLDSESRAGSLHLATHIHLSGSSFSFTKKKIIAKQICFLFNQIFCDSLIDVP
jgi:hypothetical protein